MGGNDGHDRGAGDAKKIVLARRARFLAAAVASVGIACGKDSGPPQPCLSQPYIAPDAEPMPCLSPVAVEQPDAAQPQPCLAPPPPDAGPPPEPPRPCLSPPPYNPDAGKKPPPEAGPPGPPPRPCLTPKRGP